MIAHQYRELCRFAVAQRWQIDGKDVRSERLEGPRRAGLPPVEYAVDLHWLTENNLCRYRHVGLTRWRTAAAVGHLEIFVLIHIKEKAGAHDALFFTNTSFSPAAIQAAAEAGISLCIVRPTAAASKLALAARQSFFAALAEQPPEAVPYTLEVVRAGPPPVMTKDEANQFVGVPEYKLWLKRAAADGRLRDRWNRSRLARLFPGMRELLHVRLKAPRSPSGQPGLPKKP